MPPPSSEIDHLPSANEIRKILHCDTCLTPCDGDGCPKHYIARAYTAKGHQPADFICPDHSSIKQEIATPTPLLQAHT